MNRQKQQAAALASEMLMHVEDCMDDGAEGNEPGARLVTAEDEQVGYAVDVKPGETDTEFFVRTEDGTVLRVTVRVES